VEGGTGARGGERRTPGRNGAEAKLKGIPPAPPGQAGLGAGAPVAALRWPPAVFPAPFQGARRLPPWRPGGGAALATGYSPGALPGRVGCGPVPPVAALRWPPAILQAP